MRRQNDGQRKRNCRNWLLLVSVYDNAKTLQDVTYRAIATALYDAGYRKQISEQTIVRKKK